MTMAPSKMKAVVTDGNGGFSVKHIDTPKPGIGEILVKVVAAAGNPTDWMLTEYKLDGAGSVAGCDFAGIVKEIGPGVPEGLRTVGERVSGMVLGSVCPNGAFAEYVSVYAEIVLPIPQDWSFEQASQTGLVMYTAWQCMYQGQSLASPLQPLSSPKDLLIWAGSTAVGQYAIQFAKLAGYRVISTASKKNITLLEKLGADVVLDYADSGTPRHIKEMTGGRLKQAIDCISAGSSPEAVSASLSDDGGVISATMPYDSPREGIQVVFLLVHTLPGKPSDLLDRYGLTTDRERGAEFSKQISEVWAMGKLMPVPIKLMPRGLESVVEGIRYMKEGKVSAEKLTYRVADTP